MAINERQMKHNKALRERMTARGREEEVKEALEGKTR
jgi:hypothetical protein